MTRKFPSEEKIGLVSQLRRAITSVAANIAAEMSRSTSKGKASLLNISHSSAIEVINFLILSLDLGLISEEKYYEIRKKMECISNQLFKFT